ncbi:MAG: biotin--[acetyl-CoA-carboxylase] ligase [Flavobacteriaceae bacterium]|nr:biotin--[acetyl-CoA-carboxylase] ligase [Psychroflexus sp.]
MKIIKINATESTNSFLKPYLKSTDKNTIVAVKALRQTHGRGQVGTTWQSEDNKNLIASYLLPDIDLKPEESFNISILTSLALQQCLKDFNIPNIEIKWPNDILSCKKKVAGILIENTYSSRYISNTIIGIGLNVNQQEFENLPQASSLSQTCLHEFSVDAIFEQLNSRIEKVYQKLKKRDFRNCSTDYYQNLMGYQKDQEFVLPNGQHRTGQITSIEPNGHLNVKFDDQTVASFNLKEIKQVY